MPILLSVILGGISMIWYSYFYPAMFEYIFVNVSLEPAIGPCRDKYSMEACTVLARFLLWLLELPLNIVVFGTYCLVLVVAERHLAKLQIKYLGIAFGIIIGYIIAMSGTYRGTPFWFYFVTVATDVALVTGGVWLLRHLTRKGTGRGKAAPVL